MRWLGIILTVLAAVGGAVAWLGYQDYVRFQDTPLISAEQGLDYHIPAGANLHSISRDFSRRGLLPGDYDTYWLRLLARQYRLGRRIQTGEYHLANGATPFEVLTTLSSGKVNQYSVTLVEGSTFRQLRQPLQQHPKLVASLEGMPADQLMDDIGYPDEHPEGRFLAETYQFTAGTSDADILKRAYRAMQTLLEREWQARAPKLPYKTPYEALIMASIIEKETAVAAERPIIAGVFVRRLQKGMRLQTDPTVIYGIGEDFDGDIRRKDLRTDTPYNTYTRHGLPPTPIATPGPEAIHAALHPAAGKALYFVASGDGGHTFSATLKEHNRAVKAYLRKQKAAK